jgi:hypothetical protein
MLNILQVTTIFISTRLTRLIVQYLVCIRNKEYRLNQKFMFLIKYLITLGFFSVIQLIFAEDALAWGPGVHTVIALNLFKDVSLILPSIAGIITSYPSEYLYGCLAADFFVGKSKMKKNIHAHNWHGGFRFLEKAKDDRELAYAYGLLSHLAADVVAHNFFVPNMINDYRAGRKNSHLYWEIKADYLIGPEYTKIAKDVLSMDHRECDKLLNTISGERSLKAKKLMFTQSVKLSDRVYTTRHMFFPCKTVNPPPFSDYTKFMVDLSCRALIGFLKHPETSPCLHHDPIGVRNLGLAKRNRSFTTFFSPHQKDNSFTLDKKLLEQ